MTTIALTQITVYAPTVTVGSTSRTPTHAAGAVVYYSQNRLCPTCKPQTYPPRRLLPRTRYLCVGCGHIWKWGSR